MKSRPEAVRAVEVNQSPRLVHKVYGSHAKGMPTTRESCNTRMHKNLTLRTSRPSPKEVPDVGMNPFRFRNEAGPEKWRNRPEPASLGLTIVVNLGVDLEPRLLLLRTQLRHHLHQIADHLLADAATQG